LPIAHRKIIGNQSVIDFSFFIVVLRLLECLGQKPIRFFTLVCRPQNLAHHGNLPARENLALHRIFHLVKHFFIEHWLLIAFHETEVAHGQFQLALWKKKRGNAYLQGRLGSGKVAIRPSQHSPSREVVLEIQNTGANCHVKKVHLS